MSGTGPAIWRGPAAWVAVFAGGLLGTALLAPWLYAGLLALDPQLRWPYGRVYNRLAMVVAVAILIAVRRELGWRHLRRLLAEGAPGERWRAVATGFGVATAGTVAGVAWAWAAGELVPALTEYPFLSFGTLATVVGSFVTALVEEGFFRGLMFPALALALGAPAAALASSALFSVLHALSAERAYVWEGLSAGAGFDYLGVLVAHQVHPAVLRPLFGLFLVGLALAFVVRCTGSLYLAIGLHAGWALTFQLQRHAMWPAVPVPRGLPALAGRYFVLGQPWAWVVVAATAAAALLWWQRARRGEGGREESGAAV
ncbi:MAG: CPBP family glutamic-type intramembrane protease [Thermoanaerobaculia bacterium]|nr:CPBP family glutamic-type intramembrane protease [Thermoanaerobaculia bacterium]